MKLPRLSAPISPLLSALLVVLLQTGTGPAAAADLTYLSSDPDVLCTVLDLDGSVALYEGDIEVGSCRQDLSLIHI